MYKSNIDKSYIIKIVNWAYNIIGKIDLIYITTLTEIIIYNIIKSTLQTIFAIVIKRSIKNWKNQRNIIVIIVEKMNLINENILIIMNLYLDKAKALYKNLFVVLGKLSIFILLDDIF